MDNSTDTVGGEKLQLSSSMLGAPDRCEPVRCSQLAIEMLTRLAGPDMTMASFALDLSSTAPGAGRAVSLVSRSDKRTRQIAFLSLEATCDGVVVFGARAVFSACRD
ncbi:MAG: hypothetical protein SGJ21_03510 [Alphaproteobacteria bacterium]|nr:hypothetical protein [Alphaproteobacteria bacterium]